MSREHIARIAVAVVAIPIIVWICYQGGWWLWGMIALFAGIATGEFLWAEGWRPKHVVFWLAWLPLLWSLAFYGFWMDLYRDEISGTAFSITKDYLGQIALVLPVLMAIIFALGRREPQQLFVSYLRLLWGIYYVAILYPMVIQVSFYGELILDSGGDMLIFLFAVLWIGDTAAMYMGKAIGKHRLAPTVSPNKTVEGFVGGIVAAALVGVAFFFWKFADKQWYHVILLAVGASLFGQFGDLVESMWKRSLGIKDSSSIIPGHGGVLDRFDSLAFAGPFMCFYISWFALGLLA